MKKKASKAKTKKRINGQLAQLRRRLNSLEKTEIRSLERRQKLTIEMLELLNQPGEMMEAIRKILLLLKEHTGFECIGIRLKQDQDFPYYVTNGFPEDFIEAERYLCARSENGQLIKDSNGSPVLECMCGNIIKGRTDSSFPFFTKNGSFWSNCTTKLLASTSEEDRQARTRNRCNAEGYESVALIPLRTNSDTIGLLQFNDSRKNMFTPGMIHFFERIGTSIGIAFKRTQMEKELKQHRTQLEQLVTERSAELVKTNKQLQKELAERKQAEEQTKQFKDRLQLQIKRMPIALIIWDKDFRVQTWNPKATKTFGFTEQEARGRHPYGLIVPQKAQPIIDNIWRRLLEGDASAHSVNENITKDGRAIICEWTNTPLKKDDGTIIGVLSMVQDITQRKETEAKLKADENRLRASLELSRLEDVDEKKIIEFALEEAVKLTQSQVGYLHFVNVDQKSINLYSWSKDTLKNCTAAKTSHYPLEQAGIWADCVRERKPVIHNDYSNLPDKKGVPEGHFPIKRHMSVPIFDGGKIVAIIGVGNKIQSYTEFDAHQLSLFIGHMWGTLKRKEMEKEKDKIQDQLLQSQKMEAIGSLAGGVAHDFNNLLTVIRGYTELAMTKTDQKDSLFKDLENILQSAHQASDLTRQLLLFARKQSLDFTPLNLNTTIDNLNKMLKRLIGEDIAIESKLIPNLWTTKVDKGSIAQVIMNMAVNARDAMPQGGKIDIETANVTIDQDYCHTHVEARPGQFVRLSISDTGTGMDKETIQHIFEPFFTTKETAKGTGLGLSVIYGIINQHQGWINVYSEPGHGTTFKIYLPAHPRLKPKSEIKQPIASKPTQVQGERILVVEDEAPVLKLAASVLKKHGYNVFSAASIKEAEALFKKEQGDFHMIFSDTILPDGNGLDLVRRLKQHHPKLNILMSSGYTNGKAQAKITAQEKQYPFLQKPYGVNQLLHAVREVIDAGK